MTGEVSTSGRLVRQASTAAICLLTLFLGIADHEVWTPDEPREAQMAREMALEGRWIVPQLAGDPFVEKPPFYYWTMAWSMRALDGLTSPTVIARAMSGLYSGLLLLVVYGFCRRNLDAETAFDAVLILSTMAGFIELSHWIRIDSLLALLVAVAAFSFMDAFKNGGWAPILTAYVATGLAFLTKGLVGVAVIALPALTSAAFGFRRSMASIHAHLVGAVLMLLPAAVWMGLLRRHGGPELFHEWFWVNQMGRFLGTTSHLGHIHGPFYYVGLLWVVLFPWSLLLLVWLFHKKTRPGLVGEVGVELRWPLLAWAFGGLVLLSVAGTKRSIYLYPLLAPFALLFAASMRHLPPSSAKVYRTLAAVQLAVAAIMVFVDPVVEGGKLTGIALHFKLIVGVAVTTAAVIIIRGRPPSATAVVAVSTAALYVALLVTWIPVFERYKNYRATIESMDASIERIGRSRVCGWNLDQTTRAMFPYYRDWRVPLVDTQSLERILEGTDADCHWVMVQLGKNFPPQNVDLPEWRVVVQENFETGRVLALVEGSSDPDHP